MPSPRLFVSSTCYDLKEIRNQLRKFIEDFGFEPVMSDYGDIFYNYDKHIQDSCKDEIEKCQLFILIIGNNYGSFYYDQINDLETPDSVTLQEFKKAIDTNIFKHIFINKYVDYDYHNYRKLKNKFLQNNFDKNTDISEEEAKLQAEKQELEFNLIFTFSEESYKFIFPFLDIIYNLKTGNSVLPFESFDEIKSGLKKQWSGFMYESLIRKNTVPIQVVNLVNDKLDKIDFQIRNLVEIKAQSNNNDEAPALLTIADLEDLKSQLYESFNEIIFTEYLRPRLIFRSKFNDNLIKKFIVKLDDAIVKFKWSKTLPVKELFSFIKITYYPSKQNVNYKSIYNFATTLKKIEAKVSSEDFKLLRETLITELNNRYEEKIVIPEEDDLPF